MPLRSFHLGRTVQHLRRYRHILAVLMRYGLEEVAGVLARRPGLKRRMRERGIAAGRSRPERVRLALQELGPTFIKIGQLASTRPDLIPPDYVEELERLQDRVPPEKFSLVRAEIEEQLGGRLEELFESFDPVPLAAGSIAQVHRAVTKDGKAVAVKARRPGIAQILRTECEIMESMAGLVKATLAAQEAVDPQEMVREFTEAVLKEVDLDHERLNQMRFCQNFADDPTVHIPQVYEEYCSSGVLTMEYIEGIKPSSAEAIMNASLDPKLVARRGADFVLRQIFEFGFFHTDPHPGNFFLLPGNVLAPIDFGQAARLTPRDLQLLTELVLAVVDRDVPGLVRALRSADMLGPATDESKLTRDAEELLETYYGLPLRQIPLRPAILKTFELIRTHHVRPPAEFTLMLKSLMTIESLAVELDSDFQIVAHLKPHARQLRLRRMEPRRLMQNLARALRESGELAARLPEDVSTIASKFRRGQFQLRVHHEHLENLAHTLDKSSNRISFAVIIAALLVGSSLLVGQQGAVLGIISLQSLGILGYLAAACLGIWLIVSILRTRHY